MNILVLGDRQPGIPANKCYPFFVRSIRRQVIVIRCWVLEYEIKTRPVPGEFPGKEADEEEEQDPTNQIEDALKDIFGDQAVTIFRHALVLSGFWPSFALLRPAFAADLIVVEVTFKDGRYHLMSKTCFDATQSKLHDVLTDYEQFAVWIDDVQ